MNRPLLLVGAKDAHMLAVLAEIAKACAAGSRHKVVTQLCARREDWFEWLDDLAADWGLADAMVLADCAVPGVPPLGVEYMGRPAQQHLASELVLSYPEAWFVICWSSRSAGVTLAQKRGTLPEPKEHRLCVDGENPIGEFFDLVALHDGGWRTWFDPWGLRTALRQRARCELRLSSLFGRMDESRTECSGLAVDDEEIFALLNGYSLYRMGVRCAVATTHRAFCYGLSKFTLNLLVTDFDLQFSDLEPAQTSGNIEPLYWKENGEFRKHFSDWLEKSDTQVVVVSRERVEPAQLSDGVDAKRFRSLVKPVGGPFDLIAKASDRTKEESAASGEAIAEFMESRKSRLTDYRRCADLEQRDKEDKKPGRHAAPYGAYAVAERLLFRARRMRTGQLAGFAETQILAALLAGEAKELLGDQTQTTALAALATQFEGELDAEIMSNATPSKVDTLLRFRTLECEAAGVVFRSSGRVIENDARETLVDFLPQVVSGMRRKFASAMQLDEADDCLRKLWEYRLFPGKFGLQASRDRGGASAIWADMRRWISSLTCQDVWRQCTLAGHRYVYFATRGGTSFIRLLTTMAGVILIWAALYCLALLSLLPIDWTMDLFIDRAIGSILYSGNTFFTLIGGPIYLDESIKKLVIENVWDPGKLHIAWRDKVLIVIGVLHLAEAFIGFVYLGLTTSMLYRLVMRNVN